MTTDPCIELRRSWLGQVCQLKSNQPDKPGGDKPANLFDFSKERQLVEIFQVANKKISREVI